MHTIFERLVEELRAWDLFENPKRYTAIWGIPAATPADYGKSPRHRREMQWVPGQDMPR